MDYKAQRHFILHGKMHKVILTLAIPLMFNNFIQTLYNLTDTYWVSQLGSIEIAAMTFVWPVIFLMISLGMGINVAGTALISQYIGSNQHKDARSIAGQLLSFSIILSFFLATLGYLSTPLIVSWMGGKGALKLASSQYLSIMFWDAPPLFIFFAFNAIKQGQGDTVTPMVFNVASVILNIILDPLFIFSFDLGIRGAAIATVLSKLIFTVYIIYILFKKNDGIYLHYKHLSLDKNLLHQIVKIGLPASIGQSAAAFGFIILNVFVVSYGAPTLAAFGIGNRINSLIMMPSMGIGSALATIVGQNLGARQIARTKLAFRTSIIITVTFLMLGSPFLIYFSEDIIQLFTKDMEVLSRGTFYLRLISASVPLMGIFHVLIGIFQGSGHTVYAMIMDMGRLWGLRIPMILLFKNYSNLGSNGVWYAMILSNAFICIIGITIYFKGNWQQQMIRENSAV